MIPSVAGGARRGDAPVHLNLDPLIPVVGRVISEIELGNVFKGALNCLDSSPLLNVTLVTLKCYPFVNMGDNALVKKFENHLTCSMRYLEAFVTGTASLVYNLVFGVFFSVVSAVTLGQVKAVVDQMRKHWTHSALAVAAVGVAAAGVFSPSLGQKANIATLLGVAGLLTQLAQADVIGKLCQVYQRHSQALRAATLVGLQRDQALFDRKFSPFFDYLDTHLTNDVQTLPDLLEVIQGLGENLPNIAPIATPDMILGHLQDVFAS